jgi:hypothetical protein
MYPTVPPSLLLMEFTEATRKRCRRNDFPCLWVTCHSSTQLELIALKQVASRVVLTPSINPRVEHLQVVDHRGFTALSRLT